MCQSVEYVVEWGLKHREIGPIFAMGVDEIQYARGHKYLTLVYQIDDLTRLLWVGQERTIETFEKFFEMIGPRGAPGEFILSVLLRRKYLRWNAANANSVRLDNNNTPNERFEVLVAHKVEHKTVHR